MVGVLGGGTNRRLESRIWVTLSDIKTFVLGVHTCDTNTKNHVQTYTSIWGDIIRQGIV